MGNGKEKSPVIICLSFLSVLSVLSLVMHRDVEFISRWSFECNLQETWTYYRSHMSEWCLRATSKMGNAGNEKSHAIIFWSFLSVLGRLSPVRHRDEEYISRWSFESNLQEIWTHLRRHMSEWCLRVTSEMCNGKEKSHVINSWSFLSVLETLSLVRHQNVEYISRWSFESKLQEIWTYLAVICQNDVYKSLQRWAMGRKNPMQSFFYLSLRSCYHLSLGIEM